MKRLLVILVLVLLPSVSDATNYYADNLIACTANYNPATRDCTGNSGNSYTTLSAAVAPLNPGDTLYIRQFSGGAGAWNAQIDLVTPNKTGTAGSPITIEGYPGETVTLRYTNPSLSVHGATRSRGARGYITFKNMVWDGVNQGPGTQAISISDGNHHFILDGIEIKNWDGTASGFNGDNNTIVRCTFHDNISTATLRHYGVYAAAGTNNVIEHNTIYHNSGGGMQLYNATSNLPLVNTVVRYNRIYENNSMSSSQVGGIVVQGSSTVPINGVEIYGNIVYRNGKGQATSGGGADGINLSAYVSNAKVHNNVVYDNQRYGLNFGTPGVAAPDVHNNIIISNDTQEYRDFGSSTVSSHNACTTAISCGSNKITIAAASDCLITAGDDYRLKQGSNVCRDAGTAVSTRPAPVGAVDIGAYEQGVITSASVSGEYLELVISVMTPGVLPTSAVTGITVTCGGISPCVGTPVVVSANVKPGSSNVIQVALSGINVIGTGTVSMGPTNATDSLITGGPIGLAQGLDSVSSLTITGTLVNIGGLAPPTPTWSYFKLNEGSGTVANDDTGNGHHGTVSTGITWVSDESGQGVNIPTDATFRHISTTLGSGSNPTTQAFAICVYAKPELSGNTSKVLLSSGGNGAGQRWYAGWTMVGGQPQWGIGIQGSGFSTGSEFVVTENLTLVCVVNDSAADTATLWVNGVMGNIVGKSVKSFTSYTLVGHLRVGNDGTFASNNGGFTVYDVWVWDTMPPLSDMVDLYASLSPVGTSAGLSQSQVQWEHVYTNAALTPQVINPRGDFSTDVVVNGGIALRVQYDCTGGACANIAPRLYYSTNGVDFNLPVPQTLGVDNIAMWGSTADLYFNGGVSSGCVDGFGLTENSGVTIADSVAGQTFALSDTHCRSDRYVVRVGNVPGATFWFRVKTDAGQSFAAYPQTIKLTVIPLQAEIGF